MNGPLLLPAAAIVFWGWQVDHLLVAGLLAVLVEAARFVGIRWDFSVQDQRRTADLCMYLIVAVAAYSFFTGKGTGRFFLFITWLPLLVTPLALVQIYGSARGLNLEALSLLVRKKKSAGPEPDTEDTQDKPARLVDISYPYPGLFLLSAGSANNRTPWFYLALFVLVGWALWSRRNTRYPASILIALLLIGGAGGYAGQYGLQQLQGYVERKTVEWMVRAGQGEPDPFQANTAIGSLGTLKLSDDIVARVFPEKKGQPPPDLLRNGSYNLYSGSKWYVSSTEVRVIRSGPDGATWNIGAGAAGEEVRKYRISTQLARGEGVLAVPEGTWRITDLLADKVEQNLFSAILVSGVAGRLYPTVWVKPGVVADQPPVEYDRYVPDRLRTVLEDIIVRNHLRRDNPAATLKAVTGYFKSNYTYSLVQNDPEGAKKNALEFFLTRSHSGHCEYFASATTLLLRALGLPARYVTGWAVAEYSELEECYLVRSRHAHSWGMVYVDGHWQDIDTTPPGWMALEAEQGSLFRPLADFFSWCRYRVTSWLDNENTGIPEEAGWVALVIGLLLGVRFLRRKRPVRPVAEEGMALPVSDRPGFDSEFYKIERYLTGRGMERQSSETLGQWLGRIGLREQLAPLLALHYRYRFDPRCDREGCGRELEALTGQWLSQAEKDENLRG